MLNEAGFSYANQVRLHIDQQEVRISQDERAHHICGLNGVSQEGEYHSCNNAVTVVKLTRKEFEKLVRDYLTIYGQPPGATS